MSNFPMSNLCNLISFSKSLVKVTETLPKKAASIECVEMDVDDAQLCYSWLFVAHCAPPSRPSESWTLVPLRRLAIKAKSSGARMAIELAVHTKCYGV